jgi:HSP20 family protein
MLYLTRNRADQRATRPFDGIDRILDEMTRGLRLAAPVAAASGDFAPALDIADTAAEWRVAAELPGVAPADVEVSVTDNVLTITGEKKSVTKPEDGNVRRDERRYGKFVRSFEFPGDVDAAKVAARFKDGVLVVTLPKAEASRPKTIAVKVE